MHPPPPDLARLFPVARVPPAHLSPLLVHRPPHHPDSSGKAHLSRPPQQNICPPLTPQIPTRPSPTRHILPPLLPLLHLEPPHPTLSLLLILLIIIIIISIIIILPIISIASTLRGKGAWRRSCVCSSRMGQSHLPPHLPPHLHPLHPVSGYRHSPD